MEYTDFYDFADAFRLDVRGTLAEVGVDTIRANIEEVAKGIQEDYDDFFAELFRILFTGSGDSMVGRGRMPARFQGMTGEDGDWKPLSSSWEERKETQDSNYGFYYGLTDALNKSRNATRELRKARKQKVGRKVADKTSFRKFLEKKSGNSAAQVKKLFGPLQIEYFLTAKGRKSPIDIRQKGNIITEIGRITAHGDKGRLIPNMGNVYLEAQITAFSKLKAVDWLSEEYVAQYLYDKDFGNQAQWRKVGSQTTPHGVRPIRAIISPMIRWYVEKQFQKNFQDILL
ncbi:hypothetical protein Lumi_015 [Xylophilus phage Lumi]|nr:hypothetical protein Lumi_015 [Xylophilus phage Lumi]